ncbi:MAG: hypothetical protein ACI9VS_002300 [Candidatus Binatia bacterium]|jgi:hypothetical protein
MVHDMASYDTNLAAEFHVLSCLHRLGLNASLTLGNKKAVDIFVADESGTRTVEVKGVAGKYDWPANNIATRPKANHFIVLVCYEGKITQPDVPPRVWIIPHERIGAFMKSYKTRRNVSRCLIKKNGTAFLNAWRQLKPEGSIVTLAAPADNEGTTNPGRNSLGDVTVISKLVRQYFANWANYVESAPPEEEKLGFINSETAYMASVFTGKDPSWYTPAPGWNTNKKGGIGARIGKVMGNPQSAVPYSTLMNYFINRLQLFTNLLSPVWKGVSRLEAITSEIDSLVNETIAHLAPSSAFVPTGKEKVKRR